MASDRGSSLSRAIANPRGPEGQVGEGAPHGWENPSQRTCGLPDPLHRDAGIDQFFRNLEGYSILDDGPAVALRGLHVRNDRVGPGLEQTPRDSNDLDDPR